jgi:negative regulator of genetic competence, sporulation and motility
MVQTDLAQLTSETAEWRQIMRNYRDEFQDCKKVLQDSARLTAKEQLVELEHFDNQFHIQLINIHDLKQEIKQHERRIAFERGQKENLSNGTYTEHERLLDAFLTLENGLQQLRSDFRDFINATNC